MTNTTASGAKPAPATPAAKAKTVPSAPAAPAQAAAKVKAPKVELTEEQKRLKAAMAEAKAAYDKAMGKTPRARASTGKTSFNGWNPEAKVEMNVSADAFKSADDKSIVAKVGTGKTLKELLTIDGVDFNWFRRNTIRGNLRVNGKTVMDAFGAAEPKSQEAKPA